MFPITGPQSGSNPALTNIESDETSNNGQSDSSAETPSEDNEASGNASSAIKLDLGQSADDGVHEETARFIVEKRVQIEISQSFSFTQQAIADPAVENPGDSQSPEEASARRIAGEAEQFLPGFLEESDKSEGDAREEFQQIIADAVEQGFKQAEGELGSGLDSEIEAIFEKMKSALDHFIEVFGEADASEETAGSGEVSNIEQVLANENQRAANSAQTPSDLSENMMSLLNSSG